MGPYSINAGYSQSPYAPYSSNTASASPYGDSVFDYNNLLTQPAGQTQPVQHEKKPGFLSKLGAVAKGVLNAPGKLAEGVGDLLTFKNPGQSLLALGSAALCFTPLAPIAIPATLAMGTYQAAKGLGKSVIGGAQAWSAGDLNGIEEATSGAVVSAGAGALSAYGVRAHINSKIETGGVGQFASKSEIKNANYNPKTATPDELKNITEIKIGKNTIKDGDKVSFAQGVRMLGRNQRAGIREFKNGDYWTNAKGASIKEKASAFVDATKTNVTAMGAELGIQRAYRNDPECQAFNNNITRLQQELKGADAARKTQIESEINSLQGQLAARQAAVRAEQAAGQQSAQQPAPAQAQAAPPAQPLTAKQQARLDSLRTKSGLTDKEIEKLAAGKYDAKTLDKLDNNLTQKEVETLANLEARAAAAANPQPVQAASTSTGQKVSLVHEGRRLKDLQGKGVRTQDEQFEMEVLQAKAANQGRIKETLADGKDAISAFNKQNPGYFAGTSPFILPGDKKEQMGEMMMPEPEMV